MQYPWLPLLRAPCCCADKKHGASTSAPKPFTSLNQAHLPLPPCENTTVEHAALNTISWSRTNTLRGLVGREGIWDYIMFIFPYSLLTNEPSSGLGVSGSALFFVASITVRAPNIQINSAGGLSICSLPCAPGVRLQQLEERDKAESRLVVLII